MFDVQEDVCKITEQKLERLLKMAIDSEMRQDVK